MNAGYVYVLAFDNGGVKVGRTQNTQRRLKTHRYSARKFGRAVTDSWTSPLHVEWEMNEDTLKALASKHGGTPTSPEYFEGADYAAIVSAARALPFTAAEGIQGGPACLRGHGSARECVIRTTAIDVRVRETASDTSKAIWKNVKSGTGCRRCVSAEAA